MAVLPTAFSKTKPLHVFVVEDHAGTAKYLRLYLETLGHRVTSAVSMWEAFERLPRTGAIVVLCDTNLPDGGGWELLPQIDALLPTPAYVVPMSAWIAKDAQAISQAATLRQHLDQPFALLALHAVLNHAVDALADLSCTAPTRRSDRRQAQDFTWAT